MCPVRAVVAVCPTIDLARCVAAIERPRHLPYHFNFVRNLKDRMRRKDAHWPGRFDLSRLERVWTIRKFDDVYTAPLHGFGDAANYYYRASALGVVDRIAMPTLILAAADDPVVPSSQFLEPALANNPHVHVRVETHGGHCGFVGESSASNDGYWAEYQAVDFLRTRLT